MVARLQTSSFTSDNYLQVAVSIQMTGISTFPDMKTLRTIPIYRIAHYLRHPAWVAPVQEQFQFGLFHL